MRRRVIAVFAGLALLLAGAAVATYLRLNDRPAGKLDTELKGISYVTPTETQAATTSPGQATTKDKQASWDKRCWFYFGGNPQRSLAKTDLRLGRPTKSL